MSSRLFVLGCYAFISLGVSAGVLGPALNTLARNAQISLDQAGYLFTAMAVGYLLSAPAISLWGARVGTRNMLIFSPLVGVLSMTLFALSRTLLLQLLGGVLLGLSQSGTQVAYNAMFATGPNSSKQLNQLNAFFGIGALVAPLLASLGYERFGEATLAFVAAAIITLPLTIGALFWRRPTQASQNAASPSQPASHSQPHAQPHAQPSVSVRHPMRYSIFWLICTAMALYVGCEVAFSGWTTEFTRQRVGVMVAQAAASTSAFYVGMALSRYFTASILKVSPSLLTLIMLGVALLGFVIMLLGAPSLITAILGAFVVGVGMGPTYPTLIAIAVQRFPQHATPLASVLTSSGSAGALFLPSLVGAVLTTQSASAAWVMLMAFLVVMLGMLALVRLIEQRDVRRELAYVSKEVTP